MASRRRKQPPVREMDLRISNQLAELELRIRRLEARLRAVSAAVPARTKKGPPPRQRPRCPNCTIEIPKGKRTETCQWCGFVFAAVQKRASRR